MTQDEFHGHFMAMLTGPKGPEVIDELGGAIVSAILATVQRKPELAERIAGLLQPLRDDILGLQILAQLDAVSPADFTKRRVALQLASREGLEDRLREVLADFPDRGMANSLLADLGLVVTPATEPAP
jgi:hypothetical protein